MTWRTLHSSDLEVCQKLILNFTKYLYSIQREFIFTEIAFSQVGICFVF